MNFSLKEHNQIRYLLWVTLFSSVLWFFLLMLGCADRDLSSKKGSVNIGVSTSALTANDVVRVTVTVTASNISTPIVKELSKVGLLWKGSISNIPVGGDRTFSIDAYDSNGRKIYEGEVTGVTVTDGGTASVVATLQPNTTPSPFSNTVPQITDVIASTAMVRPSETVLLEVSAQDVDNDPLTYLWTANDGVFSDHSTSSTIWTAPSTNGTYTLVVQVSDNKGGHSSISLDIVVQNASETSANVEIQFNSWPTISLVSSSKGQILLMESTNLNVVSVDADGDTLTYVWDDGGGDCSGSFSDNFIANPVWTAPVVLPASGHCTLSVSVSDGRGGSNSGSVIVYIGANSQPVISRVVSTIAGTGVAGYQDGDATQAQFSSPSIIAVDSNKNVYIFDNQRVRKISALGNVTTIAGDGTSGHLDANGTQAKFGMVAGMTVDSSGNILLTDGNYIRKVDTHGEVTTITGSSTSGYQDGSVSQALFQMPWGITVDALGNIYISEMNFRIRKIDTNGIVSTISNGGFGYLDGDAISAKFANPLGIGLDGAGDIFVLDMGNQCVRKIDISASMVSTIVGNGTAGYRDGIASQAQFNSPFGMVVDASSNVFVADTSNHRIRKVDVNGYVTTVAGDGHADFLDGFGVKAQFNKPKGIAIDSDGNLYIADSNNHRIRKIAK